MAKGKIQKKKVAKAQVQAPLVVPEMTSFAGLEGLPSRALPRYGMAFSSIWLRYPNIYAGGLPYQYDSYGGVYRILISDAVLLCQKAYFRIASFKNSIDMMSEICSNSDVYLDGGNNESKTFFEAWLQKINKEKLKDQFYRELFRSGNIFLYRVDGKMTPDGAKKIRQTYAKAAQIDIPLRYILLNPVNIAVYASLNFDSPVYYRILNKFEIDILRRSSNPDDREVFKNLPSAVKSFFDGGEFKPIPIESDKLHTIFYKKQDYEPFAVPLGYSVLDSLELKLAMLKTDAVISRTVEDAILLITMGASKAEGGTNPESLKLLKEAFKSEGVGRVLVSDYTTKAEFVVPDLTKILGDAKYRVVNEDIAEGLSNIFFSSEKRSSNIIGKLKVFVEKLNAAQSIFVNDFLNPEIKRISKLMGFKTFPIAAMGRIDLDDQSAMLRIYAQLLQMGVLTPKDGLDAIERGLLPEYETLHQNQQNLKTDKDKGLFQPLQGGPFSQIEVAEINNGAQLDLQQNQQEHQLTMTKLAQQHDVKKTKIKQKHLAENPLPIPTQVNVLSKPAGPANIAKPSQPIGRPPGAKGKISMAKLIENIKLHSQLSDELTAQYKKEKKIKKLNDEDLNNIKTLSRMITESANPNDWLGLAGQYVKDPIPPTQDKRIEMEEISQEYDVSPDSAPIVYHSQLE